MDLLFLLLYLATDRYHKLSDSTLLPQTTLEVIDLAKFPGHDPGITLNTWFLATASQNTARPVQHATPNNRDAPIYMYSTSPAAGLFSQLFTTFLSIVFSQLEIVSHILAALLTRITCSVYYVWTLCSS